LNIEREGKTNAFGINEEGKAGTRRKEGRKEGRKILHFLAAFLDTFPLKNAMTPSL